MEAIQLKLFEYPKKADPTCNEYFFKHFGWIPKVGENACIQTSLAIENLISKNRLYCMFARVVVKSIENDEAICETTDEWCEEDDYEFTHFARLPKLPKIKNHEAKNG